MTAIFESKTWWVTSEETSCNVDNYVAGYDEICNLTEMNFGIPWYCGKPR